MEKCIMTFGTFDIFHEGHKFFLSEAKKHGNLVTIIATDKNVQKLKKTKPRHTQEQRKQTVKDAGIADIVQIGDEKNPMKWVDFYNPDIICLGYDQVGFIDLLQEKYPKKQIIRIAAYKPELYKSSIIKSKLDNNF